MRQRHFGTVGERPGGGRHRVRQRGQRLRVRRLVQHHAPARRQCHPTRPVVWGPRQPCPLLCQRRHQPLPGQQIQPEARGDDPEAQIIPEGDLGRIGLVAQR